MRLALLGLACLGFFLLFPPVVYMQSTEHITPTLIKIVTGQHPISPWETDRYTWYCPDSYPRMVAGDQSQNWLIKKNRDHAIGLFQGMFDKTILTFNPGWSSDAQQLSEFTDVRELQRQLKASGVNMITEADEALPARLAL